ncbi:alpha/beta hydrolase [Streptomyces anulatus]|uniref:alpha/beta hydrolase n=1 Tax=Streptomyces anulatus TaxID=1892 RepID=UPI0033E10123
MTLCFEGGVVDEVVRRRRGLRAARPRRPRRLAGPVGPGRARGAGGPGEAGHLVVAFGPRQQEGVPEVVRGRLRGPGHGDRAYAREQTAARVAHLDTAVASRHTGLLLRLAPPGARLPGIRLARLHDEQDRTRPALPASDPHDSGVPGRAYRQSAAPAARGRRTADPVVQRAARPATGYAWAVSVARQLGRGGVLLTYEGHGHGSVTSGPCMEDAVDSYLTDLAVPPRGTNCPAVSLRQFADPDPSVRRIR